MSVSARKFSLPAAFLALMAFVACAMPLTGPGHAQGATIFLVRHAEKEPGVDPLLTSEGAARAERLGDIMDALNVDAVWSSDTRRTRATAAPAAIAEGLTVQIYDLDAMEDFAETLRAASGTILVVGHSNTTPVLAAMITGRDEGPWFDDTDYESLFRIELNAAGEAVSYQMSYDALERYASN